jgi:hypothetical protein
MDFMKVLNSLGMLPGRQLTPFEGRGGMFQQTELVSPAVPGSQFRGMTFVSGGEVGAPNAYVSGRAAIYRTLPPYSIMEEFGKGAAEYERQFGILAPGFVQQRSLTGIGPDMREPINRLIQALNRLEAATGTSADQWAKSASDLIKYQGLTADQTTAALQKDYSIAKIMGIPQQAMYGLVEAQDSLTRRYRMMLGTSNVEGARIEADILRRFFVDPRAGVAAEAGVAGLIGSGLTNQRQFMIMSLLGGLNIREMMRPDAPGVQQKFFTNIARSAREMAGQSVIPPELIAMLLTGQNPANEMWGYMRWRMGLGGPADTEGAGGRGMTMAEAVKRRNDAINKMVKVNPAWSTSEAGSIFDRISLGEDARKFTSKIPTQTAGELAKSEDIRTTIDMYKIASAQAKEIGKEFYESLTVGLSNTIMRVIIMEDRTKSRAELGVLPNVNRGASTKPVSRQISAPE